jgi:cell division protein FtsZ
MERFPLAVEWVSFKTIGSFSTGCKITWEGKMVVQVCTNNTNKISGPKLIIIKVFGIGGGGCNVINRMVECGVSGVELIAVNTDQQVLNECRAELKLPIGAKITEGFGVGGDPVLGEKAATEDRDMIVEAVKGAQLVLITTGMGGGTGTGAAPVIAQAARESGALTVGVVTKPFEIEGEYRMNVACEGINKMREAVDSLIVIQNERLFQIMDKNTLMEDAFHKADEILHQGIQSISDLILKTGLINVDFADVKKTLKGQGDTRMGIGVGKGTQRAEEAARKAVENPLLEDTTIEGATRLLINISGDGVSMNEYKEAIRIIREKADPAVQLKAGLVKNPSLGEEILITVIATGFQPKTIKMENTENDGSQKNVISIDEWNSLTTRSTKSKSEFLTSRKNYSEDDLDVPTVMRFPPEVDDKEAMDL